MIQKITIDDPEYPKNLKHIHKPPKALYMNGELLAADEMAVALVGSRRPSFYGLEICEKLAYDLALRGVTIISGMARGIDSAAHRGALRAKGRTIAVLGSGHGRIYPPENTKLYEEIAKGGAVISEFENDIGPLPYNFPQRNRIISGLSIGVVVVEAAKNSGALITSDYALEQGREVFAVPGKVSSQTSAGTNGLIKDGAKLVQTAEDILEELENFKITPVPVKEPRPADETKLQKTKAYVYNSLTENERKVYKALSDAPMHIDDILEQSCLDIAKGSKALLGLELKKLVRQLAGKQFIRLRP